MKTVTATLNVIESGSDTMTPLTDAQGFFAAAASMIEGARILASANPVPYVPHTYLCGHVAETSLKAMLSKAGVKQKTLRQADVRHSLVKLWELAQAERLLTHSPPAWLEQLDRVHGHPFTLRYPVKVHAFSMPNAAEMMNGLEELFAKASA